MFSVAEYIMNRDFTIDIYTELLRGLRHQGYEFQTFRDYLKNPLEKVVILQGEVKKGTIPKYWDGSTAERVVKVLDKWFGFCHREH